MSGKQRTNQHVLAIDITKKEEDQTNLIFADLRTVTKISTHSLSSAFQKERSQKVP